MELLSRIRIYQNIKIISSPYKIILKGINNIKLIKKPERIVTEETRCVFHFVHFIAEKMNEKTCWMHVLLMFQRKEPFPLLAQIFPLLPALRKRYFFCTPVNPGTTAVKVTLGKSCRIKKPGRFLGMFHLMVL